MILKSLPSRPGMPEAAVKYQPYPQIALPDRTWPSKAITEAPIWCSVDLRDGNQALVDPMGHDRKARMFHLLLTWASRRSRSASPPRRRRISIFARWCVEEGNVSEDVSLQVLYRPAGIDRADLRGA